MNTNGDSMDIDFKRDDDSYVELKVQLTHDGLYTVYNDHDNRGDYFNVISDPIFTSNSLQLGVKLSKNELSRLNETLEDNYWNYQEDYII